MDFLKTVNVKIKHWVKLNNDSDCENMDIFSSKLVPSSVEGRSVYKFSKVKGRAVFSLKNSVGAVELSHFCALMDGSPEGAGIISTTYFSVLCHFCAVFCRKPLLCEVLQKPFPSLYLWNEASCDLHMSGSGFTLHGAH